MKGEKEEFPQKWQLISFIHETIKIIDGDRGKNYPKKHDFSREGHCLFLNTKNVTSQGFKFETCSFISQQRDALLRKGKLLRHDIVLTTRGTLGNVAYYDEKIPFEVVRINSGMVIIRLNHPIYEHKFIMHYLYSPLFKLQVEQLQSGSAQPQLPIKDIQKIILPLPPLNEQKRIVAKLEEKQAQTKIARDALDRLIPMLERYRQSVLAAAFRGDLTKEWREQNPDVEPASKLLERIRAERKAKWIEADAEKTRVRAEAGAKKKGKAWSEEDDKKALEIGKAKAEKKYKEPESVNSEDLPELPDGWCWSDLNTFSSISGGLTRNKSKRSKANVTIPLVTVGSVYLKNIIPQNFGEIGLLDSDGDKASLSKGDILVVEGNGSLGHIGRAAIWNDEISNARHQNHLIKVRPSLISSEYVLEWLSSPIGRSLIVKKATSGAGLYTLSISKIASINAPISPLREQKQILKEIEHRLQLVSILETHIKSLRAKVDQLDQAILAKAFRGELVPQDPEDEPAAELLQRIKDERDNPKPKKKVEKVVVKMNKVESKAPEKPIKTDEKGQILMDFSSKE